MDRNHVIGNNTTLPWRIAADLKNFKKITMGKPVVMGRKTYESIGRPLPGRENIIITHDQYYAAVGCTVLHSIEAIGKHCKAATEVMIAGGAEIYRATLGQASRLYLTEVQAAVPGDTFFPQFDRHDWQESARAAFKADAENEFDYSFVILERRL